LICVLALVCALGSLQAETDTAWERQYTLREWHAPDGLPSEDVTRVFQDRSGYLWLATSRGLTRFDGAYFEDFGPELQRVGASSTVRAITETRKLGLVVAPASGGTMTYRDGEFRRLDFATGKVVNALFAQADGTLWATCDDQSLLRWSNGKTEEFRPDEHGRHRLVAHFAADKAGRIWIAGGTMFGRFESGRLETIKSKFDGPEFRVANSGSGGVWVLTVDRLLKVDNGVATEVLKDIPALLGAHYVTALHEDRKGTLWIGSRSQGLYAVVDGRLRAVPTSGEAVMGICEDTEGDIWVASNGGGLNRLRFRDFKIYDRSAGLGDNYSFTVSEDPEGAMWFGNRDGGAARLKNGRIDAFASWPGQPRVSVTSVLPDGHGRIWITNGAGVFKINPATDDAPERIAAIPSKPTVAVAYVARNGDYWVGFGANRVGRYRDGKFETFGAAEGFEGRQVLAITEDAERGILIGTMDGRLIRYDGQKFSRVTLDVADDTEAPIQDVYCEPGTGLTWIATAGNGIYVLGNGRLRQIRPADGLIDGAITTILADDQGFLWFGSAVGVFSLRRRDLDDLLEGRISRVLPVVVGRDDGLHGLTCLGLYKPSAWKSRDGRMWFATRKGVLNFDPAKAIADTPSSPAFVAAVKCDDERTPLGAGGALEISGKVRKLEFRLSVLCLSTPDRVRIKYRLDGFDSEWITAGSDRIATYPKLPPGAYVLRVASSLGNGVWTEMTPLSLTVRPLWWQTAWFQLAVAAAFVALVVLVVRAVSHRRLRLRLERLERESAIERERIRIARNIHDDLGASLTRISLLTQTAKRSEGTPESRQLGQIYETVRQITRSMDEIVWAVNPKNDHLDGLATYLVSYAQSFLSVAGIRCRLDLPDHLPAVSVTSQTRHSLYLCLKEALNNIVKHSGASEVTVAMRTVANSFTLAVSDNGRCGGKNGQGNGNGNGNGHGAHHELRIIPGQGLNNIAQRVTEMAGTYEFTPPGNGTGAKLTINVTVGAPPVEHSRLARHLKNITP
jgi:signal transduction histidine kinase/ligand-binding sensor domain-containing protein